MKLVAPVLAFAVLLVVGGCPPPEEPAAPPREPVRPAPTEPAEPREPATPAQPQVDDQQIEQQLRQQIQQDQTLSPTAQQVMIEVRNGNVTLRGQVESQEESRRIEDLALQIQGVQDVNNQLQVGMEDPTGEPGRDPMSDPDDPYGDPS